MEKGLRKKMRRAARSPSKIRKPGDRQKTPGGQDPPLFTFLLRAIYLMIFKLRKLTEFS
jgi:hypothetical protein